MERTVSNRHGKFIKLSVDEEHGWVSARWQGQLSSEDVKNGGLAALKLLEKSGCKRFLNDNRDVLGHWSDANDWIAEVWIPRAMELGLRKFAHILSHYRFGQTSAEQMQLNVGDAFQMHLFKDEDLARAWLLEKD